MTSYNSIIKDLISSNSSVVFDYSDLTQAKVVLINMLLNTKFSLFIMLDDLNNELFNDIEIISELKKLLENKYFKINVYIQREYKGNSILQLFLKENNIEYSLKQIKGDINFVISDLNKLQLKNGKKYYTTFNNQELSKNLKNNILFN